jgi:hypothetical protein
LLGLTNLWINRGSAVASELNVKCAVFVLGKIDEILAWDKERGQERDLRFVDLGRYLCEVRSGQCWRLEKMKSFELPEFVTVTTIGLLLVPWLVVGSLRSSAKLSGQA